MLTSTPYTCCSNFHIPVYCIQNMLDNIVINLVCVKNKLELLK